MSGQRKPAGRGEVVWVATTRTHIISAPEHIRRYDDDARLLRLGDELRKGRQSAGRLKAMKHGRADAVAPAPLELSRRASGDVVGPERSSGQSASSFTLPRVCDSSLVRARTRSPRASRDACTWWSRSRSARLSCAACQTATAPSTAPRDTADRTSRGRDAPQGLLRGRGRGSPPPSELEISALSSPSGSITVTQTMELTTFHVLIGGNLLWQRFFF
jgi:hypothetical protein